MNLAHLISRWRRADVGQLLRGLAAFGGAEVATRLIRILSVVVIARQVSPTIMGVAALALSLFEVVRVLANAGIGQRIIAESEDQLAATCNTAHRLFWFWCCGVSLIQLALAALLHFLGMGEIAAMLAVLSGVYLFMPAGLVQVFLLMRGGCFGIIARITATQAIADQLLTLIFVLLWPSAWAIVLPKLVTAPLWLLLVRRAKAWRPAPVAGLTPWQSFLGFAAGVLISELVNVARTQLDKLLVGALFGVQALGIYYFAFNAGLGITTSFITALGQVLFPYISAATSASSRACRCRQGLWLGLGAFLPVLVLQVGLAPWYVPLVFGEQWRGAAPLVSVLALGAVPMIFAAVASAWLRAHNRPAVEALLNSIATAAALGGLTLFAGLGLMAAAWAYVAGLALALIPASIHLLSGREGIATLADFQRVSA
ncbi:oligosaccharide flippase family protein [Halomonas sp. DP8Y7-1]|uniref:oligosaccharide flippase family protein n=1 Tax=Halomonas sp. DP8Y7-1 TaxID=2859078 RepID=UPI001C968EA6|nr:oligosaccharide flippase family protein [Halomonas sp. DP8Y7-1]MBY6029250.1 oligosaccharide flippase family protein [Halomonas sp. DP8Y7-1]